MTNKDIDLEIEEDGIGEEPKIKIHIDKTYGDYVARCVAAKVNPLSEEKWLYMVVNNDKCRITDILG
jgi:hypothetical protein